MNGWCPYTVLACKKSTWGWCVVKSEAVPSSRNGGFWPYRNPLSLTVPVPWNRVAPKAIPLSVSHFRPALKNIGLGQK
jgi:hypothetical protein